MRPAAYALAKFHTQTEIEDMQKAVLAARYSAVAINLHLASASTPDGRNMQSITLTTTAQQDDFLADAEAAIGYLAGQSPGGRSFVDFSGTRLRV